MGKLWLVSCLGIKPRDAEIALDEDFRDCGTQVVLHFKICPGICFITQEIKGNSQSG